MKSLKRAKVQTIHLHRMKNSYIGEDIHIFGVMNKIASQRHKWREHLRRTAEMFSKLSLNHSTRGRINIVRPRKH
jgi:hypothetical protein